MHEISVNVLFERGFNWVFIEVLCATIPHVHVHFIHKLDLGIIKISYRERKQDFGWSVCMTQDDKIEERPAINLNIVRRFHISILLLRIASQRKTKEKF